MRRTLATIVAAVSLAAAPVAGAEPVKSSESTIVQAQSNPAELSGTANMDSLWPLFAPSAAPLLIPIIALVLWLNPDSPHAHG